MNLNNDIIVFLFSEGKISFPGLGILSISMKSAKRSPSKNKIYGPKYEVSLSDTRHDDNLNKRFTEYLSSKYRISPKKAEKEINNYSIKLLNNLANFNSAQIDNLGEFSRRKDKIQFSFSNIFEELTNESNPDFPLLLVKRRPEQKVITAPIPNKKSKNIVIRTDKNEPSWLFPFITLTVISLLFVCFMLCISALFDKSNDPSNLKEDNTIKNGIGINDTTDSGVEEIFKSEISKDSTLEKDFKVDKEEIVPINANELEKFSIDELISMGPQLKDQFNKSCIIIVGSFHRKSNADRMVKRLAQKSFTPYIEKYNRFYRTGVVFDCNEKPLYQFLDELRSTIENGAWVLKYK